MARIDHEIDFRVKVNNVRRTLLIPVKKRGADWPATPEAIKVMADRLEEGWKERFPDHRIIFFDADLHPATSITEIIEVLDDSEQSQKN